MHLYCPRCKAEYFSHVEQCADCRVPLVGEQDVANHHAQGQANDPYLPNPIVFNQGALDGLKEIALALQKSHIRSAVLPEKLTADDNAATLGAAAQKKYLLIISESDLEGAKKALEDMFAEAVQKEGRGVLVRDVINLEQSEVTCPACGETGALENGECTSCGLFLGETCETSAIPWKK